MKILFLFILSIYFLQTTHAQATAAGTVRDENNKPVPGAFVREFKSKSASATYTDTLGFFSLPAGPYPKLIVSCKGYNDTLVNVADKKNVLIVLSKAKIVKHMTDAAADNTENPLINKNLLQDAISTQTGVNNNYVYGGGVRNYTGSLLPVFTTKEETKGSRYLFNEWAHGSVVNADNSIFNNQAYWYNYDKMEGGLLLTQDKQSAIEADKAQIKSFTLYVDKDEPFVYESVPSIDNAHFIRIICSGIKFKIYKLTKTKFVKSNYHTDGIATSGNPYDEYIDEDIYFVLNVGSNEMQKLSLKKRSLKEVFASQGEKLNNFFTENSNDTINDNFLKHLGDYLNN